MPTNTLPNDWKKMLESEFSKPYFTELFTFLKTAYATKTIFPPKHDLFNALHYTSFSDVKVVILGQDPYHGAGQADGLSFSVQQGVPLPPSLRNIFKELTDDLGCAIPDHGNLVKWADQGVLLLNTVLTVEEGQAHAHRGKGWESFTDTIIRSLNEKDHPVVYLLWGKAAQQKIKLIDMNKHVILTSAHPSPLSAYRGFFGSKPFSKTNAALTESGQQPITWT